MNKVKTKGSVGKRVVLGLCYGTLVLFMLFQILPFYFSFVESLQPETYRPGGTLHLWPESINIKNYLIAWQGSDMIMGIVWSLIYAGGFTFVTVIIISLVAYVLAKKKFLGIEIRIADTIEFVAMFAFVLMSPNAFIQFI